MPLVSKDTFQGSRRFIGADTREDYRKLVERENPELYKGILSAAGGNDDALRVGLIVYHALRSSASELEKK